MFSPGAAISTSGPRLENFVINLFLPTVPTAIVSAKRTG
jgi:hypothetical protein